MNFLDLCLKVGQNRLKIDSKVVILFFFINMVNKKCHVNNMSVCTH